MEHDDKPDLLPAELLSELKTTIPNAYLGFPPPKELQRPRDKRHAAHMERTERLDTEREVQFQKLKLAALANLRKDRP